MLVWKKYRPNKDVWVLVEEEQDCKKIQQKDTNIIVQKVAENLYEWILPNYAEQWGFEKSKRDAMKVATGHFMNRRK